ncbi:uncharacterized protein CBL_03122 [Carabus blaptoides fortunei]
MTEFHLNDVLNPELIWMDGSCFRVNRNKPTSEPKQKRPAMKAYNDNEDIRCDEIPDFDIEVTENGRFKTRIRMPHTFYAYIIGTKGSRRKKIEEETKTEITVPKQYKNNKILITGPTESSVAAARRRIEMIGNDLRNRHQITHFISFALVTDEIKDNFKKFKDAILTGGHIDGVDESIFQKVDKIHLTIGTLVLLDSSEIEDASEVLEKCKKEIIDPQLKSGPPLIIKMKGLQYMNDDPSQVDVLYAKVNVENHENPDILQKISDDIVEFFYKNGLMKREYDKIAQYRQDARTKTSGSILSFDSSPSNDTDHYPIILKTQRIC